MKTRLVFPTIARTSIRLSALLAIAASAILLNGCAGYSIGAAKPKLLVPVESLAVPNPINKTLKPRIEVLAADSIIKQIQQDGTYKVASAEKADAVLETTIIRVDRTPARSVRGNVRATREFNIRVEIAYKITDNAGVELQAGSASGDTTFFVGSDANEEERIGIPRALEAASVALVSQISEGW